MKRKLQKDEIGNRVHMGVEVKKELNIQEHSVTWLATKIGHDSSNLYEQLKSPYVNPRWLYEISKVLKKDFFVFYSKQLDEKE